MSKAPISRYIYLFGVTFASAFLLFFGVGMLVLTFAPALAAFQPQDKLTTYNMLPEALERDEKFIDVESLAGKQLFPELSNISNIKAGNWISIPSIKVDVPLALSPSINDADIITTLEKGMALYPNGIQPGRLGNVFIAGHNTGNPWHGPYRFALLEINEIKPGHTINLDYEGTRYTYRVTDSEIVKPDGSFRITSDRPVPTITLMACWPRWSTTNRMLVHGELTNVTKLTAQPK